MHVTNKVAAKISSEMRDIDTSLDVLGSFSFCRSQKSAGRYDDPSLLFLHANGTASARLTPDL